MHPDDRDGALARESRLQLDGRVRSQYRMIRPDGQIVWLVDDAALARTPEGRVVQDGFLVDITEQKRAELMLATQAALVEAVSGSTDLSDILRRPGPRGHGDDLRPPLCHRGQGPAARHRRRAGGHDTHPPPVGAIPRPRAAPRPGPLR